MAAAGVLAEQRVKVILLEGGAQKDLAVGDLRVQRGADGVSRLTLTEEGTGALKLSISLEAGGAKIGRESAKGGAQVLRIAGEDTSDASSPKRRTVLVRFKTKAALESIQDAAKAAAAAAGAAATPGGGAPEGDAEPFGDATPAAEEGSPAAAGEEDGAGGGGAAAGGADGAEPAKAAEEAAAAAAAKAAEEAAAAAAAKAAEEAAEEAAAAAAAKAAEEAAAATAAKAVEKAAAAAAAKAAEEAAAAAAAKAAEEAAAAAAAKAVEEAAAAAAAKASGEVVSTTKVLESAAPAEAAAAPAEAAAAPEAPAPAAPAPLAAAPAPAALAPDAPVAAAPVVAPAPAAPASSGGGGRWNPAEPLPAGSWPVTTLASTLLNADGTQADPSSPSRGLVFHFHVQDARRRFAVVSARYSEMWALHHELAGAAGASLPEADRAWLREFAFPPKHALSFVLPPSAAAVAERRAAFSVYVPRLFALSPRPAALTTFLERHAKSV